MKRVVLVFPTGGEMIREAGFAAKTDEVSDEDYRFDRKQIVDYQGFRCHLINV